MINDNKITCFQLHYTSCRYGNSGHAGFQTRALSSSIKPDEQRAVERLGIYQPPRNLSTEPDQKQLTDFPKAYRNAYLETGRLAVIKSVYVGQDYTRRPGNYFSHSLIIKNRLPDDIWAVDLYEWDGWKDRLLPEEDTENTSFELEPVSLIPDTEAYSFTVLEEFLNEDSDRKNQFANMIQALFMRQETSRNVVIKDNETNGLFWIACLQKSFPPSHQKELDCSSYQFDPRACLAINVTLGDTDFVLGENERKYQFYVFDFVDGKVSEVGSINEYATTVSTWMCEEPDKLQDFYTFCQQFNHNTLNNEIISLLHLFKISIGINKVLEEQELVNILEFVNSYTKPEKFDSIIAILSKADLIKSENPVLITHLAKFFINIGKDSQIVSQLIIGLFDKHLFNYANLTHEINELRVEAKKAFVDYDKEFSRQFLLETHLSKITEKIDLLSTEKLSLTINELISSIVILDNQAKVYENDKLRQFVKLVVLANVAQIDKLEWLLNRFIDDELGFASICTYISEILASEDSIKMFAILLNKVFKNAEHRFVIINKMKLNSTTWEVLEELWKLLPKKEQNTLALILVGNKQNESFSPELVKAVFQNVSEQISFDPKDRKSNELYDMIVVQMKTRNIVLSPNRVMLRYAVRKANITNFDFDEQPIGDIKLALTGVDETTYKEFSQFYLPLILSRITQAEQHGLVIKAVFHSEYSEIFKQSYALFYQKNSAIEFNQADMAALMFWLDLKSDDEDYRTFRLIKDTDLLLSRISKLKDKEYSKLLRLIKNMAPDAKAQWEQIFSQVEEKRNTLFRRFLNKWRK
jgi:hypothetical protein